MMLGIDASAIHVIADNGAPVEEAMVAWALELPKGQLVYWTTMVPACRCSIRGTASASNCTFSPPLTAAP
jgi:hypothetical protein